MVTATGRSVSSASSESTSSASSSETTEFGGGSLLPGPAGLQAQVLRLGRQQVPGAHVTRAEPLAPRHPLRCQDRVGPGQQHRFVQGDVLRAGGPRDGHGPAPAPVAEILGLEVVRDDAVPLGDHTDMLTDHAGRGGFLRRARQVYRLGTQAVRNGGTGRTASRRRSTHRSRFSPYASLTSAPAAARLPFSARQLRAERTWGPRRRPHPSRRLPRARLLPPILRDRGEARGQEQPPVARYARYPLRRSAPTCPSQTCRIRPSCIRLAEACPGPSGIRPEACPGPSYIRPHPPRGALRSPVRARWSDRASRASPRPITVHTGQGWGTMTG
ncbi:hypothetical protein SMICM17S_13207 [Streptomyces microflavus]